MDLQISIRVCSGTEQSAVGGPSGDEGKERCTRDIGMVSIIVDNSARCIPFRAMALVPGNSLHPSPPGLSRPGNSYLDAMLMLNPYFRWFLAPLSSSSSPPVSNYTQIFQENIPFFSSLKRGISCINKSVFLAVYTYMDQFVAIFEDACNDYISRYNFVNTEDFVTLVSSCLSFQNARFRQSGRAPGFKVESDNRS